MTPRLRAAVIVAMNTHSHPASQMRLEAPRCGRQSPTAFCKAVDDFSAQIEAVIGPFQAEPVEPRRRREGPGELRSSAGEPAASDASCCGQIDSYSSAPTARQIADIDESAAEVRDGAAEVNKLFDEMPRLNKTLADAGVPYFCSGSQQCSAAPKGGRGGGANR